MNFNNTSTWLRSHAVWASFIVLLCSMTPRLFLTVMSEPGDLLKPDSGTYLTPALSLIDRGRFQNSSQQPEITRTPGYPVFLAVIMSLVGKNFDGGDLRKIVILQTVILSFSVLILYWLARRILPPAMAFAGALLAAFSPWGAVLAGLLLTEGLFVFVLASTFLLMKLVQESGSVPRASWLSIMVGLLTAAAVLIRPVWPFLFLVAGGLFFRYGPKRKGAWLVLTVMVVSTAIPLLLWNARNIKEAGFHGLSDNGGKTAWWGLASRVKAQANGVDRWTIYGEAGVEERQWGLSVQEADNERWRRARVVFQEHPVLTAYNFALSVAEHIVHPSPLIVLASARLNFYRDYWVLALLWGTFLTLAWIGWRRASESGRERHNGSIDRDWLLTLLVICLSLTLLTGVSFGGGSRLRAPLELIVPLLAGVGLVHVVCSFQRFRLRVFHRISKAL